MAFIIKALGTGVLTTSGTVDGYVVPANRTALVTSIRLVNGGFLLEAPTASVKVKPSGAASVARSLTKNLDVPLSALQLIQDSVTLGQGDAIQISIVFPGLYDLHYSIFGVERD